MQHLVITTCNLYPEAPENLRPLAELLRQKGLNCSFEPWQKVTQAEAILPLCAWDYAEQPQQFENWIERLAARGCRFLNPPEMMRWNMNKNYLCDLQTKGISIIPSLSIKGEAPRLREKVAARGWHDIVLKPAIGQSGKGVIRLQAEELPQDLSTYPQGVIIQPYMPEVAQNGETSLIFLRGKFSHGVCRLPKQGDFRANSAYGVQIIPVRPQAAIIAQAEQVLRQLAEIPFYARVDATLIGEDFVLNELELIEPALYLHTDSGATARFADAILEALNTN
ncbi:glutathione synthetase-like protein [Mesocricetibacter intestinalis]|uniref:Glutathione synthetase-like protein n=1 Tax=Mesocricetibacter intestinalis TaxID=1521930 RepID=A0A4V3D9J8_9PAST|nr:glutathione synthetase [Mesocricetibacter intestinalis]TDQ57392.1 glutathione synthetase-like protein [Mesocricetibacter intestinalis]